MENSSSPSLLHPLEPLDGEEIKITVNVLKTEKKLDELARFVTVVLNEPSKELVLNFKKGDPIVREAFVVLLDKGQTYEAIVSITTQKVISFIHIPNVQPSIMLDEFMECELLIKASPDFRAALEKRGCNNPDLVMVEPWSAGNYGVEAENGKRLLRAYAWVKMHELDNGYAHPLQGVICWVDMTEKKVIKIEDHGVIPLPTGHGDYRRDQIRPREGLKPLEIIQKEGPSFTIEGHSIKWQKWHIRFGFTPREGVILHNIGYEDQGRIRPILYRAGLSEMVVPYGDPSSIHSRQNAFDVGEYGFDMLLNSLQLGCDCLGEIRYFDAFLNDSKGNVVKIANAICLHEEDFGIGWKHTDWRTDHVEVRRSRRLVLSCIATVGNYEYGTNWYFYQDGTISFEIKLTGIVFTAAVHPEVKPKHGVLVAPQLYAPIHQHFFNVRMDFQLDG